MTNFSLDPARDAPACLLRRAGPPSSFAAFQGVRIDDERLAQVVDRDAPLLVLYDSAIHSEGPVWDPHRNRLVWSDVSGRRVMARYDDGHVDVVLDATPFVNGNALDHEGNLLHCEHLRRCISKTTADSPLVPLITHYHGKRLNTPNDIAIAPDRSIWFTDPIFGLMMPSQGCLAAPELSHRSVYRYDPSTRDLRRMADFDQPNGLHFSRSGDILYVSDTARAIGGDTHEIVAFDHGPAGDLSNRRVFCEIDPGVPDGFLVDRRDWLWTTAADGLHVFAPDGTQLGFVPTPTTATNCAIGGINGDRLFITAEAQLLALDLRQASA